MLNDAIDRAVLIVAVFSLLLSAAYLAGRYQQRERDRFQHANEIIAATQDAAKKEQRNQKEIRTINDAYSQRFADLQSRLEAALNQPAVVRVVRLPASTGAAGLPRAETCAGQPSTAGPETRSIGESTPDYQRFRERILRLGADAELLRQTVIDAQASWPL